MSSPSMRIARRSCSTPLPDAAGAPFPLDCGQFHFIIEYPSRLRPKRNQTVCVRLAPRQPVDRLLDLGRGKPAALLPIRLLVPGAVVIPAEHSVEASPFGAVEVTFQVAALAEGDLPGARLEILRQGLLETTPLPLRCESARPIRRLVILAVVLPLLLQLPAFWPELAGTSRIELAVRDWLPNVPALSARAAQALQGAYDFLAGPGRETRVSFFTFFALVVAASVWAFICRPQTVRIVGEPFAWGTPTATSNPPPILSPASIDDLGMVPAPQI